MCALLAAVACVAMLCTAGCSPPKALRTYQFVADYQRMEDRDPLVSLLYLPRPDEVQHADTIVIGDIGVGGPAVEDPDVAVYYANLYRIMLSNELKEQAGPYRFADVLLARPVGGRRPRTPGTLVLDGQVTVFDMGSGLARFLGGLLFLQTGATDLQVEGRLTDLATGRTVMEFADRRRHLGNTAFGPNPKNLTDHTFAMKITALYSARSLAMLLVDPQKALAMVTDEKTDDAADASEED
jgi:hypothetical protein